MKQLGKQKATIYFTLSRKWVIKQKSKIKTKPIQISSLAFLVEEQSRISVVNSLEYIWITNIPVTE